MPSGSACGLVFIPCPLGPSTNLLATPHSTLGGLLIWIVYFALTHLLLRVLMREFWSPAGAAVVAASLRKLWPA